LTLPPRDPWGNNDFIHFIRSPNERISMEVNFLEKERNYLLACRKKQSQEKTLLLAPPGETNTFW